MFFYLCDGGSGIKFTFPVAFLEDEDYLLLFQISHSGGNTTITMYLNYDDGISVTKAVTSTTDPTGIFAFGNDDSHSGSMLYYMGTNGRMYWGGVGDGLLTTEDIQAIQTELNSRHTQNYDFGDAPEDAASDFDIDGFTYSSDSKSMSSEDSTPRNMYFKHDLSRMYMAGGVNDSAFSYTLSTPGTLSTASYDNTERDLSDISTNPYAPTFSKDGKFMLVCDSGADDEVVCYFLATAWEIESAAIYKKLSVGAQNTTPRCAQFSDDGTVLWVLDGTTDSIDQYNLSDAYNLDSATYDDTISVAGQETNPQVFFVSRDGTKMALTGIASSIRSVYQYTLSTPYDITTATYDSISVSVNSQDRQPAGLYIPNDGSALYVSGDQTDTVYEYT
jgi:hypothetical protein